MIKKSEWFIFLCIMSISCSVNKSSLTTNNYDSDKNNFKYLCSIENPIIIGEKHNANNRITNKIKPKKEPKKADDDSLKKELTKISYSKLLENSINDRNKKKSLLNEEDPSPKKFQPFAIAGFIFSIFGIFPLWIIGSILGMVFCLIAIKKINQHPDKYKGETLADIGLALGAYVLCFWAVIAICFLALYGFLLLLGF